MFKKFNYTLLLVLAFLFINTAAAQMSGAYTLDSTISASTSNFKNWKSFWQALQGITRSDGGSNFTGGISASVTLDVKSNLHISEALDLPAISGTSSTKTITILGRNKTITLLSSSADPMALNFRGADYFIIRNLIIKNNRTGSRVWGIRLGNGSDNNIFRSCTVQFAALNSGSQTATSAGAYIAFTTSTASLSSGASTASNGYNNTIDSCTFTTLNTNSPGPTFGIFDIQNSGNYTSTTSNNIFSNNKIENFYLHAIYCEYVNSEKVINNNISRTKSSINNCATSIQGIALNNIVAGGGNLDISGNTVGNLPFSGASSSSNACNSILAISVSNGSVGTGNFINLKNNKVSYLCAKDSTAGIFTNSVTGGRIDNNKIENCENNTSGWLIGIVASACKDIIASNNTVANNKFEELFGGIAFWDCSSTNECRDNIVEKNVGQGSNSIDLFCLDFENVNNSGDYKILRNKVLNNDCGQNNTSGTTRGVFVQNDCNAVIGSNLIANNIGFDNCIGMAVSPSSGFLVEIQQNTVVADLSSISTGFSETDGINSDGSGDVSIIGNIFHLKNADNCAALFLINGGSLTVNYNSYYFENISNGFFFLDPAFNFYSDMASWQGSGVCGGDEIERNPKFKNPATNDFTSQIFLNQNNVPTISTISTDINNNTRNTNKSDRGAFESALDIVATQFLYNGGSSICGNSSFPIGLRIKNTFTDTIYNFKVSYKLNNNAKVSATITNKIKAGDSLNYYFSPNVKFNNPGTNNLIAFLDFNDDKNSNDTVKKSITVKSTASGSAMTFNTAVSTTKFYNNSGNLTTIIGEKLAWNVSNPTYPSNLNAANYNTAWTASVSAKTQGGFTITGADAPTLIAPSGTTPMRIEIKITDTKYEDTSICLIVKITNSVTGCDTFLSSCFKINPTINPKFTAPATACVGDTVYFSNNCTVKSGSMDFKWYFGTSTNDSSSSVSPAFIFKNPGTYTVKLVANTLPLKFSSTISKTITINAKPIAKFTINNACEPNKTTYTNQSTPATATSTWEFKQGANVVNIANALAPGTYSAKLTVDNNGCKDVLTKAFYVFAKPKPAFKQDAARCQFTNFTFTNTSTIASGTLSTLFLFDENGNKSTQDTAKYIYKTSGTKNVKLISISEFGCKDSITKQVIVYPAPDIKFAWDKACSLSSTNFTNQTAAVSGTVATYKWDFGDGTTATTSNAAKSWNSIGKRNITLNIDLDNGCKNSLTKEINVLVEPKSKFSVNPQCRGLAVKFNNQTTYASGAITYTWTFGGAAGKSNAFEPFFTFDTNVLTGDYKIKLVSSVQDGCTDSTEQTIAVNSWPGRITFNAVADYSQGSYPLRFSPKDKNGNLGGAAGLTYYWNVQGVGNYTSSGVGAAADMVVQLPGDGTYCTTLRTVVNATGCDFVWNSCPKMNRANVKNVVVPNVKVFPNPSSGKVTVQSTDAVISKIEIYNSTGNLVANYDKLKTTKINLHTTFSAGVYYIKITTDKGTNTVLLKLTN